MIRTYRQVLDSVAAVHIPDDLDLYPRVRARLNQRRTLMQTLRARPALAIALVILALLLLTGAAYAIGRLTGYIPGIGLIDQSAPLRVLAEPVVVTRQGITLTVERAVLSAEKTIVVVKIEGVPMSAYPQTEAGGGCLGKADLKLPDGTLLEGGYISGGNWGSFRSNLEYGSVPANVKAATLQVACIGGTIAGALPANWEIPLRFAPAPPDMTVVPVVEVSTPTFQAEATAEHAPVHLEKAMQIGDEYILMGNSDASGPGGQIELGLPELTDANGRKIVTSIPDIQGLPASAWSVQFNGVGIAYPVTLSFTGRIFNPVPDATAEFVFDAGENPQPGQQWVFNQDFSLGGHHVRLVSISVESGHGYPPASSDSGGYDFEFQTDPDVRGLSAAMPDVQPAGGGGGGAAGGVLHQSLEFVHIPKGSLRVVLSDLTVYGGTQIWKIQWQPETLPTAKTASTPNNPSLAACNIGDNLEQLPAPPSDMQGQVLLYRQTADAQTWGLVWASLDGSQARVVVPSGNWGALSPDGGRMAYSGIDGALQVVDLESGGQVSVGGMNAYNPVWSPDGSRIAYIDNLTVDVVGADGSGQQTLTQPDHYAVVGWSQDGTKLYYTQLEADGFAVHSVDVATGELKSLFTLQDSSHKAPDATISPDGSWIAYRGSDNAALHLVRADGSDQHVVMGTGGISGMIWSKDSQWLGMSLLAGNSDEQKIILLQPDICQAYLLPKLQGDLEGLFMP